MSNEFFAGFHPPEPPEVVRQRVLAAARTARAAARPRPVLGRMEWALLAAALVLAVAHLVVPATSPPGLPTPRSADPVAAITGDPAVDALLVAEAGRWEGEQHRRLMTELGL